MTQEENNSSVEVKIFDQTYSLCGPDPGYIRELAEYVDARMRITAEEDATTDSEQLAVLAAVRIASEYHLLKTKLEGEETETSGEEETTGRSRFLCFSVGETGQAGKPVT